MKKLLLAIATAALAIPAQAQMVNVNGSFENWRTYTAGTGQLEAPAGWHGLDSLIYKIAAALPIGITPARMLYKDAGAYRGQSAVKIMSRTQGSAIGNAFGLMTNAQINFTLNPADPTDLSGLTFTGGTPVTQRIKSVRAWVKYQPKGIDTAAISVQAVLSGRGAGGRDSIVGGGDTIITGNISTYTMTGVNLSYVDPNVVPDRLMIIFVSSAFSAKDSSTLWVDEVEASPFPLSIGKVDPTAGKPVQVVPNPARDLLYVHSQLQTESTIAIYGVDGRLAAKQHFLQKATIDVAHLPAGTYYYYITGSSNEPIYQDKLVIAK